MDPSIDSNMEDAVRGVNELSDAERQECRSGLNDLAEQVVDACDNMKMTGDSFREMADTLDQNCRDCRLAHAAATGGGIVSSVLGLLALTIVSGGTIVPLVGLGFGAAGALTSVGTGVVEAKINSSIIKKAEKLWGETLDSINVVTTTVQSLLHNKEAGRIVYILYLAEAYKIVDPVLLDLLHDVVSNIFGISIDKLKSLSAAAASKVLGTQGGKVIAQLADDATQVGKTGLQVADDMAQVGKAGLQASDDAAQAGFESVGKYAGKVMIVANVAFLMVDCIDLAFTVRDILKNKGSEAAKDLRRKARQLDDLRKKWKGQGTLMTGR